MNKSGVTSGLFVYLVLRNEILNTKLTVPGETVLILRLNVRKPYRSNANYS